MKDNQLKQWRDQKYIYNAWGNLVEKRSGLAKWQTFTYDCENRLVRSETMLNSQIHSIGTYQYDSLGRRVAKQPEVSGQTQHKHFLWQDLRMLREESPGQSSVYVYEPGSYAPLARIDHREGEAENTLYYFHTDQIGTPLEMTDIDGQIVWQAIYRTWHALKRWVLILWSSTRSSTEIFQRQDEYCNFDSSVQKASDKNQVFNICEFE